MHYKEMIKDYQAKGFGSEKKMWASIDVMEEAMICLKEKDPEAYEEAMRNLHEVFCGPHYNEHFAKEDVSYMRHKNKSGKEEKGEHWNMNQAVSAIKGTSLPSGVTDWDIYVALNANWHDKEVKFTDWWGAEADKHIIDDAINFYFQDEDAPEGKIWLYMDAMD